jgi:hypothetical protein
MVLQSPFWKVAIHWSNEFVETLKFILTPEPFGTDVPLEVQ